MPNTIKANPAKRFFVEMLTRDIDLDDAILDLLDNSLDGLLRITKADNSKYSNYKVEIFIDKNKFEIRDNCGGIPTDIAQEYAFRMGRPSGRDDNIPTIGMYGIGMKRSVFKMGKDITISSKNDDKCFTVAIPSQWLTDDDNWELTMEECSSTSFDERGTVVTVKDLYLGISKLYNEESDFISRLIKKISVHYAFILKSGFKVYVNGKKIEGKEISLLSEFNDDVINSKKGILPYIYHENNDGLEIEIICGLVDAPPSLDEDSENAESSKVNRVDAGWTIMCNERVVVYADRTMLTGWGDGLPQFHYQFNTLVGVVSFKSNQATKLPVTTTKRGIDASSDVFLRVRKKMIEGMRLYVDYTNKWKNKRKIERETILPKSQSETLDKLIVSKKFEEKMITTKDGFKGRVYKPKLPIPSIKDDGMRNIKFSKHKDDIKKIALEYFENDSLTDNLVGEKCFEEILAQLEQED